MNIFKNYLKSLNTKENKELIKNDKYYFNDYGKILSKDKRDYDETGKIINGGKLFSEYKRREDVIDGIQKSLNKIGFNSYDGNKLKEDGIFGTKTKAAYDNAFLQKPYSDPTTERLRKKNYDLVSKGLKIQSSISKLSQDDWNNRLEIANYQRKLNDAGFTDFEDKPLKEDGIYGSVTQSAVNSYIWEDNNNGLMLLSAKAHEKPNYKGNPNKRKGSEKRQPSGDRERNIGHPDGEEHSRVPKGSGNKTKSRGFVRSETTNNIGKALVGGVAAVGAGYLVYRGVRMLPSLLPPLWWTIPANLATP